MEPLTREAVIAAARDKLAGHPAIRLGYLHGSFAGESPWAANDIDIAVYVEEHALVDPWFVINLERDLNDHVPAGKRFEVRVLNRASIPFCFNAIFRSPRLVVRDEAFMIAFETRVLLMWYDMEPTWQRFHAEQSEVLAR